jgi:hypothetical protein
MPNSKRKQRPKTGGYRRAAEQPAKVRINSGHPGLRNRNVNNIQSSAYTNISEELGVIY